MSAPAWLRRRVLGIAPQETTFARRGFSCDDQAVRGRLEQVGASFVDGYHAGLETAQPDGLAQRLSQVDVRFRGFAFEGAAMSLALLDRLTPWRRDRWRAFLEGPGNPHFYMVHVGAGWAIARLPWLRRNLAAALSLYDPLPRWLVVDGYGFHEGYFDWKRSVRAQRRPAGLASYAARAFDQGLGRSLWFVEGASESRIAGTIGRFEAARRADLWSGVGLAGGYAAGMERASLARLRDLSGEHFPRLGQGAAFAAKARLRAGNMTEHTELACGVLCGMPAPAAAAVTDEALVGLPSDGEVPAYEVWRTRIQARMMGEGRP